METKITIEGNGKAGSAVWVDCDRCAFSGLLNGSWIESIVTGNINNIVEVKTGWVYSISTDSIYCNECVN